ncbi:MAG TPA: hypothetical protein VE268_12800 [Herpetosiphonaceae bacterium]|nr:hypothetical protein [Herpetosiphonaceae bacterium]
MDAQVTRGGDGCDGGYGSGAGDGAPLGGRHASESRHPEQMFHFGPNCLGAKSSAAWC